MVRLQRMMAGLALGGAGLILGLGALQGDGLAQVVVSAPNLGDQALKQTTSQTYTRAMLIGYAAAEQGDYHTALINFRRALAARPGDRYARAAIRNMETYIAQERAEAAKQAEIARLEGTLSSAVAASDWACAAASVDRLVVLVPPTSVDRARLIAYRGEIAGLIESRANLDQWSTVCPGGQV
jgi:tetratricopeptide (TPR) repeat protein